MGSNTTRMGIFWLDKDKAKEIGFIRSLKHGKNTLHTVQKVRAEQFEGRSSSQQAAKQSRQLSEGLNSKRTPWE